MADIHYLHAPMAKPIDELPNNIRFHRKRKGKTLAELGDAIGLSAQFLGMLERGERHLTDRYRVSIARALDVDPVDLFLPDETPFAVPPGEREFWADYVALPARARQLLREQAKTYRHWQTEPEDDTDQPQRA